MSQNDAIQINIYFIFNSDIFMAQYFQMKWGKGQWEQQLSVDFGKLDDLSLIFLMLSLGWVSNEEMPE